MPIQDSSKIKLNALCADSPYVLLVDLNHPTFSAPVHIIADTLDLTYTDGTLYKALPMDVRMPSDSSKNSTAQLQIDNVGRTLTEQVEAAKGLDGGTARLRTIFRSEPDKVVQEFVMDVTNMDLNVMKVTLSLGFEDLLNRPAVSIQYRPETVPGLF